MTGKKTLRALFPNVKCDNHQVWDMEIGSVSVKNGTLKIKISGTGDNTEPQLLNVCKKLEEEGKVGPVSIEFAESLSAEEKLRREITRKHPSLAFGENSYELKLDNNLPKLLLAAELLP